MFRLCINANPRGGCRGTQALRVVLIERRSALLSRRCCRCWRSLVKVVQSNQSVISGGQKSLPFSHLIENLRSALRKKNLNLSPCSAMRHRILEDLCGFFGKRGQAKKAVVLFTLCKLWHLERTATCCNILNWSVSTTTRPQKGKSWMNQMESRS